jgi:signal transduction histidine kinase
VLAGTDPTLLNEAVAWAELAAAPMRSSTTITELGGRSYLIAAAPILSLPATAGDPVRHLGIALVGEHNPSRSGRTAELRVGDSGPGVGVRIATEVFEHGFTTKAAQNGERGIGLALTRLICRRWGGEVEVTNTADGAEFVARMTIAPAETNEMQALAREGHP